MALIKSFKNFITTVNDTCIHIIITQFYKNKTKIATLKISNSRQYNNEEYHNDTMLPMSAVSNQQIREKVQEWAVSLEFEARCFIFQQGLHVLISTHLIPGKFNFF